MRLAYLKITLSNSSLKLLLFCFSSVLFLVLACNRPVAPTQIKLEELKQANLFDHLTEAEYDGVVEGLIMENVSLERVLRMFPDLIYQSSLQVGDSDKPYEDLLLNFARISRGRFQPTDIQDGFGRTKEEFPVSFNWQGETYEIMLRVSKDSDSIDWGFIQFINKTIAPKTGGHKFKQADGGYFVLLNEEQFQLFEKDSLINVGIFGQLAPFLE